MKAYLDSEDSYYHYNEESIKEESIKAQLKQKKDYAGIGAIIFTFTVLSIVIGLSIYTAYQIAYGQGQTDNDFMMELSNASRFINHPTLTLFAIEGESYREICPSGNCTFTLDLIPFNPAFFRPQPHIMDIYGYFYFTLKDNVDNPNIGTKKQEYLEKFHVRFNCTVEDIIEDNGQEIYTCNGNSIVKRDFDSREWYYNTKSMFDAKNDTVKVYGKFWKRIG